MHQLRAFNRGTAWSELRVGQQSAIESIADIEKFDSNTKMVFITAGMAAEPNRCGSVIAQLAKNVLTVGIVTIPFQFEGKVRIKLCLESKKTS
jgi:cell division protein FtsZ